MIFSKEEALLIIDLKTISLVTEKEGQVLEIPDYVVKDKTIIDEERFHFLVRDFLKKYLKQGTDLYIVLSENLTIKEDVWARNSDELSIQLENILKNLSYKAPETEKVIIPVAKEIFKVIITKTEVFRNIVAICHEIMLNPRGVFPWVSLHYNLDQKIEPQAIHFVIKNLKSDHRNTDFMLSDRKEVVFASSKNRVFLMGFGVFFILLIGGGVLILVKKAPPKKTEDKPTAPAVIENIASPSSTLSEASSSSDESVFVKKEELRVLIENGTGVVGQSASVKSDFEGDGFTSIDAKNYDDFDQTTTVVFFSKVVSPEDKKSAVAVLEKRFSEVVVSDEFPKENFEVEIITGGGEL
ncbi:hypothetical protein COY33_01015 [candidate division WWE3 bacterium CG_4_10_14_0_2_um_filter_42_7]|uniref:LytR/CpsA/Psr regulator C-terminal domain-containing protein n=2 Tax=Katanobacteria TaxID=422282 RepID=A0A2H0X9I6_UNCKA|nr:MAG: hypothetical protein COT51_01645 [candidate division WWE3 bacterium CG08_land_8_20_14_0_20_41_15]PIZ43733.1 MAG: hypothetical protein COY33_01015 [candidate division WWE3 bacterium CG_4_10_14_0_2_um_filter_42_7]